MRQLMDLHKGKKEYSKDKKMVDILDGEIEKEKKKLLKIIKPRFKKVFLKYFTSLDDNQILKLGMYLSTFNHPKKTIHNFRTGCERSLD